MTRVFFDRELDTAASWWRIFRKDGVTLGFTTHDRDLWFGGILHRAAPGMLPSAIRKSNRLSDDESEIEGAPGHDTIRAADIAAGRFDGARIESGIVDWETLENASLYSGSIAAVSQDAAGFTAQLQSAKADLDIDPVPRASPSCRARFCASGCSLSSELFSSRAACMGVDLEVNAVRLPIAQPEKFVLGELRWIDGPQSGQVMTILGHSDDGFELDQSIHAEVTAGHRAILRQGCDKTIATCATRFDNAINFQGEPHLPGNDLLAQYPQPR